MITFVATELSSEEVQLRDEVRAFLSTEISRGYDMALGMLGARDEGFSRRLAEKGWIGLTLPTAYGGSEGSAVDRFVVAEELLAAGAPVSAHWVADRQTAPMIMRFGSEAQRQRFLPAIAAGRLFFSLGMSEPEAGSDLAAVRTVAHPVEGGFRVRGRKVWTSGAAENDYCVVLCRTSVEDDRHSGLSQLIIDLSAPGVRVEPIRLLDGSEEFCEVFFDDVFVPENMLLGSPGDGWQQVTSELAYERAGPDRLLSPFPLLRSYVTLLAGNEPQPGVSAGLGRVVARTWAVRRLLMAISRSLDRNADASLAAAVGKYLATEVEQDTLETVDEFLRGPRVHDTGDPARALLNEALLIAPSWTIRGGTTEVLSTVIARGLRNAADSDYALRWFEDSDAPRYAMAQTVSQALQRSCSPAAVIDAAGSSGWAPDVWKILDTMGADTLGIQESDGGLGGDLRDICMVARLVGRFAAPVPFMESALAAWALARAGIAKPEGVLTMAQPGAVLTARDPGGPVSGHLRAIPWAPVADNVVTLVQTGGGVELIALPLSRCKLVESRDLAGQLVADLSVEAAPVEPERRRRVPDELPGQIDARGALLRASALVGAMERAAELAVDYAANRQQFGRPIDRFQAVQRHLVIAATESALASVTVESAVTGYAHRPCRWLAAIAKSVASGAARAVGRASHQVHGAMGVTEEYELQVYTRRLSTWREEFGSERQWNAEIGEAAIQTGGDAMWSWISQPLWPVSDP